MPIERGKIREFARATKSQQRVYFEGEHPLSPATFLMSSAFWLDPENEPYDPNLNLDRILHGEQEFVFSGEPPHAGTTLVGRKVVERTYSRQGRRGGAMTFTVILTEFRNESGAVVAEGRTTLIETELAPVEDRQ
jgi:hypothetical protein